MVTRLISKSGLVILGILALGGIAQSGWAQNSKPAAIPLAIMPKKEPPTAVEATGTQFPIQEFLNSRLGKATEVMTVNGDHIQEFSPDIASLLTESSVQQGYQGKVGNYTVQVFQFPHPDYSFGVFSTLRPAKDKALVNKESVWVVGQMAGAWVESEFVLVRTLTGEASAVQLEQLATEIITKLQSWHARQPGYDPKAPKTPFVVRHLPAAHLDPETLHFAVGQIGMSTNAPEPGFQEFPVKDGMGFTWASYGPESPFQRLVIADYPTPQDATSALLKIALHANRLPTEERTRRMVQRRGNFIVEAYGVNDWVKAQAVISTIEYDYEVQWLTGGLDQPPPPPEPPGLDPVVEAHKTATMLISTFRLIGLGASVSVVVGLAVGLGFFYWRRKSTMSDSIFSDAGGMLRLNLNDSFSIPASVESGLKQLEPGE